MAIENKLMKEYQNHIFSPYRVCPLGAHVDYQHGVVTEFAINKGVDLWSISVKTVMSIWSQKPLRVWRTKLECSCADSLCDGLC